MVTEQAILHLRSGASAAFVSAAPLLVGAIGYHKHRLVPVIDRLDVVLFEVERGDISAHIDQFESSAVHTQFMTALTPFLGAGPHVIQVQDGMTL